MTISATDLLLSWYDNTARVLPWRAPPGKAPTDPYQVWLSEIMLQQTVVATVKPYFARFVDLWPTVETLAAAPRDKVLAEWAGLGFYARARNLHKCAQVVATEHGGRFPETVTGLLTLPGIGPYTAGAIAAIAFGQPVAAIDGNVERVMARFHAILTPLPDAKPAIRSAIEALIPGDRPGDFAQAVMDLGATVCIPKAPRCPLCPLRDACSARSEGITADLPKKAAKKPKPERTSTVYAHFNEEGEVLMETRPDKGLLGGMIGLPGPAWTKTPPDANTIATAAPGKANWRDYGPRARHVFTHFTLDLQVLIACGPPLQGRYIPLEVARSTAPTVMRKALDIAASALSDAPFNAASD